MTANRQLSVVFFVMYKKNLISMSNKYINYKIYEIMSVGHIYNLT